MTAPIPDEVLRRWGDWEYGRGDGSGVVWTPQNLARALLDLRAAVRVLLERADVAEEPPSQHGPHDHRMICDCGAKAFEAVRRLLPPDEVA